jgi:hypothetical protein
MIGNHNSKAIGSDRLLSYASGGRAYNRRLLSILGAAPLSRIVAISLLRLLTGAAKTTHGSYLKAPPRSLGKFGACAKYRPWAVFENAARSPANADHDRYLKAAGFFATPMLRLFVMGDINTAIKRKARRHAIKAMVPRPRCRQCDTIIDAPRRLASPGIWARIYCSSACRQAAWRDRHGE